MYETTKEEMKRLVSIGKITGISYGFMTPRGREEGVIGLNQVVPEKIELSPNTLYDMASLTKVIGTTTIILQLLESGEIQLDSPLHRYLPEFRDKEVTIRELLTHTSDINPFIPNRHELNQEELREKILALPSGEKRGKKVSYTDTGTILLGFLIEKIYGQPVQEVMAQRILKPLEMSESCFYQVKDKEVAPTEITPNRQLIKGYVHDPKAFVLKEYCGSAGLFSNVRDTMKFANMMLSKGHLVGNPFLKEETVLNLLRDQTLGHDKPRSLGWDLLPYNGRYLLYHTGYTGTFMILDIEEGEGFIFLSNRVHPVDNREEYLELRDHLIQIYLSERQNKETMV